MMNLKLHDASKELPKKSCNVIAFLVDEQGKLFSVSDVFYSQVHNIFNCRDWYDEKRAKECAIKVTWWAYMPEELIRSQEV